MTMVKFLVVEYDAGILGVLRAFLIAEQCEFLGVSSEEEMMEVLDKAGQNIDAVIIGDPNLAGVSILEIDAVQLKWFSPIIQKVQEVLTTTPVISYSNDEELQARRSVRFNIRKPGIDELKEAIREIKREIMAKV